MSSRNKIGFDLYLIADTGLLQKDLISSVRRSIDGGVKAVQLRGKNLPAREILRIGERLRLLTSEYSVKLFINDRIDVAMILGADGVHLGQNGLPVGIVRKILGDSLIIGVSTHSLKEAKDAERGGADFITFGPIFATPSKVVYGPPVGLRRLVNLTGRIKIPVFAIGGINMDRIQDVMKKGANGVAVISAILNSESVYDAAASMLNELRLCKHHGS
ncbi:MAG: thiamine-phosphate diphosphorylase [Nitrospirae bacterium RIFCSPLOWO2_02_42_7]|nr:MAG: thiamine-phosphate diphosphorylase [Nitrospirae bacterium RIFCSPLOWO2_02_42_7]OGW58805.1 MAG: thiamine-phosphate diphosphorylase [Nitrospirae bacterium RIFCSPHIGHO2_02_FULL_42_12]